MKVLHHGDRRPSRARTLRLGVATVVLLAAALAATAARAAGSLRVGTYNTHLIVGGPFGSADWATEDEKVTAAVEIAARINASDYDVLALNEVMDEEARDVIHRQTRAKYPWQVVTVHSGDVGFEEDSGLMLLSRHPFATDPLGQIHAEWAPAGHLYNNGELPFGLLGRYLQFAAFDSACNGNDCLADKGVGAVAVNVTMGAGVVRRAVFLFTHLQATAGRASRTAQFEIIHDMFRAMDYHTRFTKDDVFILGDLNVNGSDQSAGGEWAERFTVAEGVGSWFLNGGDAFRDAWYNEGFISDTGHTGTAGRSGARLDYILRNTGAKVRSDNLCNQHMSRAYNLQFGPGAGSTTLGKFRSAFNASVIPDGLAGAYNFSDHLGLNMELGLLTDHCSPLSGTAAQALYGSSRYGAHDLAGADRNLPIATSISVPGAVAWYRLQTTAGEGAFAFMVARTTTPGSNIEIYDASDFSRPLRSYKGDFYGQKISPATSPLLLWSGRKFLLEKPGTYYVKVALNDRSATGTVRWKHIKLDCGSQAQYCPVAPNEAIPNTIVMEPGAGFPDVNSTVPGQSVHAIDVPGLHTGASQTIVIGAIGSNPLSNLTLLVTDKNGTALASTAAKRSGDADCRDANGGANVVCRRLTLTVTGPKRLYIYGIRASVDNAEAYQVFWKSPAVVVHGSRRPKGDYVDLFAKNTRDGGFGSTNDEMGLALILDGKDVKTGYERFYLNSEFEQEETYWLDHFFARLNMDKLYFTGKIQMPFREDDGGLNGPADHVVVEFPASELVPATGPGSFGPYSAAKFSYRDFNLSNSSSNSRYWLWIDASRGWAGDCFNVEDIGCHESWQDWDLGLLFPR